jgi:hypothetical protein
MFTEYLNSHLAIKAIRFVGGTPTHHLPSFPRRRESSYYDSRSYVPQTLDSRLRGNDGAESFHAYGSPVRGMVEEIGRVV